MLFLIFPFLQTLDYITIVLLLAGIFVAGSLFFGSGHNLRSFFAGRRQHSLVDRGPIAFHEFFLGRDLCRVGFDRLHRRVDRRHDPVDDGRRRRDRRTAYRTPLEPHGLPHGRRVHHAEIRRPGAEILHRAVSVRLALFDGHVPATPSPASSKRPSASPSSRVSWLSDCSASSTWPSAASGPSW